MSQDLKHFDLEHFLPYRLSLLSNTVSEGISLAYRTAYGLSVTEWRVIAILGRFPGLTASQIRARGMMDKVAVSRAVAKLVEKELVAREDHEEDRRRVLLRLTKDKGRTLFRRVVPLAMHYEEQLLTSLSASERSQLDALLEKLQAAALALNASDQEQP
ncbi:MAG: MarR family transcriptional regulator [Xanthomonadales bacterium]|nr:MarR family transcriptional regulator [Xanthomonadales bacterium]